ncbi:MAG: F0F1 ATP synthase subunit B [Cyclobacteriaceae bacterium]
MSLAASLVDPAVGLIIWQTVIFLIVFTILALFVWKPILSALKTREHQIEDSLRAAENAKEEMEQIKSDNEYLLQEARIERDQILKTAKEESGKIIDRAKAETSDITQKMIQDAQESIEGERRAAVKEIRELVASLSVEVAEKILREKLSDDKSQKDLVDKFIKEVEIN